MNFIELEKLCILISRGYTDTKNDFSETATNGYTIDQINFSDINDDGTFEANKQIILKNKSMSYKYMVSPHDVLLPSTIKTMAKAKRIKSKEEVFLYKGIYSSNIVILRLEEQNNFYTPYELCTILNTDEMQKRLLNEVYSNGKVKAISMEKLRQFKVPLLKETGLQYELNLYKDYRFSLENQALKINNLIKDILS